MGKDKGKWPTHFGGRGYGSNMGFLILKSSFWWLQGGKGSEADVRFKRY